jgi:hypothetical protein
VDVLKLPPASLPEGRNSASFEPMQDAVFNRRELLGSQDVESLQFAGVSKSSLEVGFPESLVDFNGLIESKEGRIEGLLKTSGPKRGTAILSRCILHEDVFMQLCKNYSRKMQPI